MLRSDSKSELKLSHLLIGPPLETAAAPHQSISNHIGLAVFASDALSSTAYATQEILLILAIAGTAAFSLSIPIALAIAALLAVLTISYRQTIHAYPNGGGAYIVSRDNLGEMAAQVAAAALLTDYVLTVSVSIASGVDQIISAAPNLLLWRVEIAVALIVAMTIINLRGVKESGQILAIPTYFFLGTMAITLAIGLVRWLLGDLSPLIDPPALAQQSVQSLTLFLILRAFSSGCTALTGVEAISNGIPAFHEPRSHNAAQTLTAMSLILGAIFVSMTFLAYHIGAMPSEDETVISQLGRAIYGAGAGQIILLAATTLILIMAANTSFADFPRLAALAAADGFLPRQLTFRGSRLVFSWGITLLAGLAALLLVLLQADTSRLIPLYAIGVFLSFTLSQFGMVVRWRQVGKLAPEEAGHSRHGTPLAFDTHWRTKLLINGAGGVMTALVMCVFAITKFRDGAWMVVLLIPLLVLAYSGVHRHYRRVAAQLSLGDLPVRPHPSPMRTILLVADVHAGTLRLINFAQSLGQPWQAVHVAVDPEKAERVRAKWAERVGLGELIILPSPYRSLTEPLRSFVQAMQAAEPNAFIHLLVGQLSLPDYGEQLLHCNSNLLIDMLLRDMDRVVVTSVPYQIDQRQQYEARLAAELDVEPSH
ncbi:MAG: APC family permease [Caldilineaceae bacterium]